MAGFASLTGYSYFILDFDNVLVDLQADWSPVKLEVGHIAMKEKIDASNLTELVLYYPEIYIKYREKLNSIIRRIEGSAIEKHMWKKLHKKLWGFLNEEPWSVLSNNLHFTVKTILSRENAFPEYIIGRDDVMLPKPYPEGMRRLLKLIGRSPSSIIYIGDSILDEKTAKHFKVPFINITSLEA